MYKIILKKDNIIEYEELIEDNMSDSLNYKIYIDLKNGLSLIRESNEFIYKLIYLFGMTTKLTKKDYQILKERGITDLIHFTPLANLKSIIRDGLKPCKHNTKEDNLLNKNTRLCIDDEFVSFSVEHSNYMYLNSLLEKYNTKIVILVFSSSQLL